MVPAAALVLAALARADWYVTEWSDTKQPPSFPLQTQMLSCSVYQPLQGWQTHLLLPFALHFISSASSLQSPWRDCLYLCSMGRATACLTVNLLKSAEALHPWPGNASIQVTPAEKGMVMSLGGSLLGSKVCPAYQGELEKSVPLALLLFSICHL